MQLKAQSEQLEREQGTLSAAQKKAEKELSWKCGVRDHLDKFADVRVSSFILSLRCFVCVHVMAVSLMLRCESCVSTYHVPLYHDVYV